MIYRLAASALLFWALSAPAAAKDKKPVDPDKKICRNEAMSGSRLPKMVCHTKAEWDAIDEANNEAAGRTMRETH